MNYRHAYHAGGSADVFKHVVLIALLERLKQKRNAFFVLETHAGIGLYDLAGIEASKTQEYQQGAAKILAAELGSALLGRYRQKIRDVNPVGELCFYPGSPILICAELRPEDRAAFCELHEEDYLTLRRTLLGRSGAVHYRDGYEAIGAFVPPPEKRGMIFIDPPFETPDEFTRAGAAIRTGHLKFPQGVWALWYPVKERPAIWRFQEDMAATGIRRQMVIEFMTNSEADSRTLNGSGILLINPPYRIEEELAPALEELRVLLAPTGSVKIDWLVGE